MSVLAGKVAVVTGASRGIGAAVASRFSAEGAIVIRLARSLTPGRTAATLDLPSDLTREADVERAAAEVLATFGPPDLLVSNAGAFMLAPLASTPVAEFERQWAVNARAPFLVARAFLPAMREAGRGRHIAVGSVSDYRGFPENAAYASSKFALRGLHEVLREEFRDSGIRFTLISPGPTDTAAWDAVNPDERPGFIPRRGMLRPDDVADAVHYVATSAPRIDIDWIRLGPA
ncbi:MAG TPA: SDR family oxidoreductase [Gemmatimonadales bacterium]|nr:SDR family oxidoreductase [Gemmatimonadales bacterium]